MQSPQLMLCKPSTNDRWDRRAVELAAYAFKHGHCNVPEVQPYFTLHLCYPKLPICPQTPIMELTILAVSPHSFTLKAASSLPLLEFSYSDHGATFHHNFWQSNPADLCTVCPDTAVIQDKSTPYSLGSWVRKQRALWQQASLSLDRIQILSSLGFELGSETHITDEWEFKFDQLQECLVQLVSHLIPILTFHLPWLVGRALSIATAQMSPWHEI